MRIEWGNVPAYFGGIALLLTIVTLQRDHREKSRAQASKVAAWTVPPPRGEDDTKFRVFLRNASELPVTGVRVVMGVERKKPQIRFRKDQGPEGPLRNIFRYRDVLAPGATENVEEFSTPVEVTSLEFTDSSGRVWHRTKTGLHSQHLWRMRIHRASMTARRKALQFFEKYQTFSPKDD
jgi:hypothetical protein